MDKKRQVEVLALLEAFRIESKLIKERSADYAIRVCQSIIASVFGYGRRADWKDDIQKAGLIDYSSDVNARNQYKALTELVKNPKTRDATERAKPGSSLSVDRKLDILFELLEFIRKKNSHKFHDWKDADDRLFAELGLTKAEVVEIYMNRGVMIFTASCIGGGGTECCDMASVPEQSKAERPLVEKSRDFGKSDRSDIALNLSDIIESAVTLAGFEVLEGGRGFLITRHGESDTDFVIKMEESAP